MKKNNSFITISLIVLLIIIRIVFYSRDEILYVVYAINLIGLFYVIIQILYSVNETLSSSDGIEENGFQQIRARISRNAKKKFIINNIILFVAAVVFGVLAAIFSWSTVLGIVNDVIALVALGLSIEDERIYEWVVAIEKK
uniref:hypothetical protein n=1 Tax=Roseburia sp. TaxID=2049040 RepID=UPI003FEF9A0E